MTKLNHELREVFDYALVQDILTDVVGKDGKVYLLWTNEIKEDNYIIDTLEGHRGGAIIKEGTEGVERYDDFDLLLVTIQLL